MGQMNSQPRLIDQFQHEGPWFLQMFLPRYEYFFLLTYTVTLEGYPLAFPFHIPSQFLQCPAQASGFQFPVEEAILASVSWPFDRDVP